MPHHWFRVAPGASGARANDAKIRKTVKAHGGKVLFIGWTRRASTSSSST